ncbi:MAG TPA: hypothetical protein VF644_03720 [Pyrinomonadaceae bacterium]|jgi:HTH-type transcriptional regulator/antitoxin HigA
MTANVDIQKYGALLAETLPAVIRDDTELNRLTEVANRLATKGIKENGLSLEENRLLELIVKLIEDYESEHYPIED